MASEWRPIKLGEVCTKIGSGATPRGGKDVYVATGPYALIRSQNIHNDGFSVDGLAYIGQGHASELENVAVLEGDVLLNITGDSVARCSQVDPVVLPARVNQHVAIIRPDPGQLDPRFLRYALVSPHIQQLLLSWAASGATRHALTKSMIESLEVVAPVDVEEQRAIADILGALDAKIALNRRMTETLEALARTLFQSWLVGLDLTRRRVTDLIAEGVLEVGDGYRAKNSEMGTPGLPFIRAGDLRNGIDTSGAEILRQDSVAKAGRKVAIAGDVAFTSKGTVGRFARVSSNTPAFVYSPQVCYWRSLDAERVRPAVLYCWMQSEDLKSQIHSVARETDMAPYVSLRDQRKMTIPDFPASQAEIAAILDPLLGRQALASAETRTLAALRDTLLPKLISGDLHVPDTERFLVASSR